MTRAFALLVLLCPIVALANPNPGDVLHMASCPGEAAEYDATLRDQLVLDRAFLDEKLSDEENIRLAALQKLKYFWGYYRTHKETYSKQRVVLGADDPEIKVVGTRTAPYGADLVIDWKETAPELQITDTYTAKAVKRGFTHKDDPALVVDYEARFRVAICGAPRPAQSKLVSPLPADPWLMHWHVPARERRLVKYFGETAVTNPCVDDDYADLPHPIYHWYDWLPERHGPDANGKPFDCRKLLHAGVDYFPRTIELARAASPKPDFASLREHFGGDRPIGATVLIGVLDHEWKSVPFDGVRGVLGEGTGATLSERAASLLDGKAPFSVERGTEKFLRMLADLPEIARVDRWKTTVDDGYLHVDIDAHLRRSGRALALHAYVGLTDIFGPTPPGHWPILRRGLASDDVVIYAGHSGIGENFRLAQIESHLGLAKDALSTELRRAPYQLIAFLSCFSYMYFGRDLEAAARRASPDGSTAGRAFVYTGTEFTKGDRGALALLDLVDQVLGKEPVGTPSLHFVEPSDFLILKEARATGTR